MSETTNDGAAQAAEALAFLAPEVAFLLTTLGAFAVPLIVQRLGRGGVIALLPIYLIIGNALAESFVTLFAATSFPVSTSLAVPIYSTTFLIIDMIMEHYGRRDANRAIFVGFLGQVVFLLAVLVVLNSQLSDPSGRGVPYLGQYQDVFGRTLWLVVGSFTAYILSQLLEVSIYDYIRGKTGKDRLVWVRNNVATAIAQGVDTLVFMSIAFYGRPPFDDRGVWWKFVLATWILKLVIAAIDTPYLYASRRLARRRSA